MKLSQQQKEERAELKRKLSSRLRETREISGMSAVQLAQEASLTPSAICKYEKGTTLPTVEILARLATSLGVTTDYLLYL